MKIITTTKTKTSCSLFDENDKLIGEILSDNILGTYVRLKVGEMLYTVTNSGFLLYDVECHDQNQNLIVKIDSAKNRLFDYSDDGFEIYHIKSSGWCKNSSRLYRNSDDTFVLKFSYQHKSFTKLIKIEVDETYCNALIILVFFYYDVILSEYIY